MQQAKRFWNAGRADFSGMPGLDCQEPVWILQRKPEDQG
jgi:hypothetical protein